MSDAVGTHPDTDADLIETLDAVAGTMRDPYPLFAEYREREPVWRGTLMDQSNVPPEMIPAEQWSVFRYDDVNRIFRDTARFDSSGYNETIGLVFGKTILGMDGPEHRAHRNLVAHAFKERSLQRWEPECIAPVCHELIDAFVERGQADLVRELTFEFPTRVIARILGLPPEDLPTFRRLSIELIGIAADIERGLAASLALQDFFHRLIDERRKSPSDDVISDLVTAEVDGERLTDEAIYSFLRLLLPAGIETTYRSSGNLLFLLLTHPDQLAAVGRDRSLLPQAIEEALRLEPPLTSVNRTTRCDVELGGQLLHEGASVTPVLGSANRDPRRWDDPDTFDIFRPQIPHISFAAGPHLCLGLHLARLETRVAVSALLDRVPELELQTDRDPHIRGLAFRSPTCLPVTFRPTSSARH